MTEEVFTLRRKELDRLEVIRRVVSKRLRRKEAACQLAAWHSPDQASGASLPGARPPGSRERPVGGISPPGWRTHTTTIISRHLPWAASRPLWGGRIQFDYLERYNVIRPHRGLGNRTPGQTLARHLPWAASRPLWGGRIQFDYLERYNVIRPHRGLGNRTPGQTLARHLPWAASRPPTWRTHTTTIISRERPAGGISPPMWWTHTKTGFV